MAHLLAFGEAEAAITEVNAGHSYMEISLGLSDRPASCDYSVILTVIKAGLRMKTIF